MTKEDLIAISKEVDNQLALIKDTQQSIFESNRASANATLTAGLPELINNDKKLQNQVKTHKKRKFNIFKKLDHNTVKDRADTIEYSTKYEKEQIYYIRHKGILDQYDVPENSGFSKMRSVVIWDIFITWICYIIGFPIYFLKKAVELFASMKRSIMWSVIIIVVIIVVVVGVSVGIAAIINAVSQPPLVNT